MTPQWFDVDKGGMAKVLARRGIEFAIGELLANAWDEKPTRVEIRLEPISHKPLVRLIVEDDSISGFANLSHAWILFAESKKKSDPTKSGKFNLGEKLVFALAKEATIETTTGTVRFDLRGRHRSAVKRPVGSRVDVLLPMTREELARCEAFIGRILPPSGITTFMNGTKLEPRTPLATVETALETEVADETGRLRRQYRSTEIHVHRPREGEKGTIYELGLPVQDTGDEYHYDIQQRVPVGFDRDSVTDYYLSTVREAVLKKLHAEVEPTAEWVTKTLESSRVPVEAVRSIVKRRFGEKTVAYDPSDVEAVHRATAAGYTVVHGGSLSGPAWESVRRAGVIPAAGKVFPTSPGSLPPDEIIGEAQQTPGMRKIVRYAKILADRLMNRKDLPVVIVRHARGRNAAQWNYPPEDPTAGELMFNISRLGLEWFENGITDEVVELLLHEFAHSVEKNHLSDRFADTIARFGAKMRNLSYIEYQLDK